MTEIRCSIRNCHYWGEHNVCKAEQIMVTSDTVGAIAPDMIDAPWGDFAPGTEVETCMQTCCKTFVDQHSDKIKADRVKKA